MSVYPRVKTAGMASALAAASASRAVVGRASRNSPLAPTLVRCNQAISKTVASPGGRFRSFSVLMAQRSEEVAAVEAAAAADTAAGSVSIFDKIVSREIPSTIIYEDDKVLAFRDINPQAPTHIVLVPKSRDGLTQLVKAEERHKEILGHLLYVAKQVAVQEGLDKGYRVVINDGPDGCQSVYHLHLHIIGGRQLKWPPG